MKKAVTLLFIVVIAQRIVAQGYYEVPTAALNNYMVSPEAAAVMKYVDYPVSPSTGVPDITIPLYTIRSGDLVFPVELKYHSSGIRPNERSGWIATGWTLTLPAITRSIKGLPDENQHWNRLGFIHNPYVGRSDFPNDYMKSLVEECMYDEQQDAYYYQILNDSGRFLLEKKNGTTGYTSCTAVAYEDKHVDIMLSPTQITDPWGVKYLFYEQENSVLNFPGYSYNIQSPTRWLCTQIRSGTNNDKINFSYSDYTVKSVSGYTYDYQVTVEDEIAPYLEDGLPRISMYGSTTMYYKVTPNGELEVDSSRAVGGSYTLRGAVSTPQIQEKYLKEITFPLGRVVFITSNSTLQNIIVYNNNNEIIKSISLYTSQYNPYTSLTKLDSVKITESGETKEYTLEYGETATVPKHPTMAIDHWGYYNGATQNKFGIPRGIIDVKSRYGTFPIYLSMADVRESKESNMKKGILTSITTPEGIRTEFEFEANKATVLLYNEGESGDDEGRYMPIGGLRVKKIVVRDSNYNTLKTTYYEYGIDYLTNADLIARPFVWGGGTISCVPTLFDYGIAQKRKLYDNNLMTVQSSRFRTFTSNPVTDLSFPDGRNILYPMVKERTLIPGGEDKSTLYFYKGGAHAACQLIFSRFNYDCDDWMLLVNNPEQYVASISADEIYRSYWDPDMEKPHHNRYQYKWYTNNTGKLLRKEEYSGDKLTYKEEYTYYNISDVQIIHRENKYRSSYIPIYYAYQSEIAIPYYVDLSYIDYVKKKNVYKRAPQHEEYCYCYTPLRSKVATRFTDDGKSLQFREEYTYNLTARHKRPITKTYTASDGIQVVEEFKYPEDTNNELLIFANRQFQLQEHKKTIGNNSVTTCLDYGDGVLLKSITEKIEADAGSSSRTKANYEYTNSRLTYAEESGGVKTGYIWSYSNQYPIAKLENIPYSAFKGLASTLSAENKIPSASDFAAIESLSNTYPNSFITTYQYKPLMGISKIKDPAGKNMYFTYDAQGRLIEEHDDHGHKLAEYSYRLSKTASGGSGSNPVNPVIIPIVTDTSHYTEYFIVKSNSTRAFYINIHGEPTSYRCEWRLSENTTSGANLLARTIHNSNEITIDFSTIATSVTRLAVAYKVIDNNNSDNYSEGAFWFYFSKNN